MRGIFGRHRAAYSFQFPFLFGGTFIEGLRPYLGLIVSDVKFPFLFGGTFIEGHQRGVLPQRDRDFPSFSEGLSLRAMRYA